MAGRIENLKPWKPGQSGNPGGRPKRKWLTDAIEEMLQERLDDPKARQQFKDAMWRSLVSGDRSGVMTLQRIWERTEGKLAQPLDVNTSVDIGKILEEWRNR